MTDDQTYPPTSDSMTDIFGVSLVAVMIALLALLALCLAAVGLIAWRQRILFEMGLRNIPRRRAQSILIVLGLMLSTTIVAAALATGDTVNNSITNETYTRLGHVDEIVQARDNQDETSLNDEEIAPPGLVPISLADSFYAELNGDPTVDGVIAGLRYPVPAKNFDSGAAEPEVVLMGIDPNFTSGFEDDIVSTDGVPMSVAALRNNEAFANESAARALGLDVGSHVDLFVGGLPRSVVIAGIVRDRVLTGWTQGQAMGVLVKLERAQTFAGVGDFIGFIAISNSGGVRDGLDVIGQVAPRIEEALGPTEWELSRIKEDRIARAEDVGSDMVAVFVVLGLFTIAAGELLVFLILVMLAAERRSEMGMARAVGMKRLQLIETFLAEGMAYSLTSAAAGALLGVGVSLIMTRVMDYIFRAVDIAIAFHVTPESIVISYCLGVVLTFLTVTLAAWRVSRISVIAAVRDLAEPARSPSRRVSLLIGAALLSAGVALSILGIAIDAAAWLGGGVSLAIISLAFFARLLGRSDRLVFTSTSGAVLLLWALIAGDTLNDLTGPLDAGVETFFIGGAAMVAAATFAAIYNAELLLGVLGAFGGLYARALPAVRTGIAYPLANRFRTGMTIGMMSLVVFALVLISTLSLNFRNLFLDEDARGGWDIVVQESTVNRFPPATNNERGRLGEELDRAFHDTRVIESVSEVVVANPRTTDIAQLVDGQPHARHDFVLAGVDGAFIEQNGVRLQARANQYASDRDAWRALGVDTELDPPNAIIDGSVVPGINYANVTEGRFTLEGYESGTRAFEPFDLRVFNITERKVRDVRVVGIMERGPSETYAGLYLSEPAFSGIVPSVYTRYYVNLVPGHDAAAEAQAIEERLADSGVISTSIKEEVEKQQRVSSAFFYLVQGFMALGLGVGLAALGVIAFRSVVERRQQIGLMRAIGFTRANIAWMFVLESAFVAVLAIINGTLLALLLANRILQSDRFDTAGFSGFAVPWWQIGLMALLIFVASVLTTIIPSRQAASVPPAEALRYE